MVMLTSGFGGASSTGDVFLRAYKSPKDLHAGVDRYFKLYNTRRPHSALDRRTPDAVFFEQAIPELVA
jgi:putative transposase